MFARVRQLRVLRGKKESRPDDEVLARVAEIERRLAHLESALEGLQDAVHRESVRRNEQTADLRNRTEPGEMARALSDDARERGL
jgi:uncharacterized coiled-coil protein SlyX